MRLTSRSLPRCPRGAAAVEFAIIAPLFFAMLFGSITFGSYLAITHNVQQIAAEAARASIAGLTDAERVALARGSVSASAGFYPLLAAERLTVQSAATDPATSVFSVTLRYDASDLFVFDLPRFVPALPTHIVRSAAIKRGGF